jgi:DNA-binding MarR family transcriptional regulator
MERLEAEGYIRKVPSSEDHRVWHVHLTTKGLKISDLHDQVHQGYAGHFEKSLTKEELGQFVALLNKVIRYLGL